VIQAASRGGDAVSLTAHYQTRVLAGFQRHLALCFDFYKSGCCGVWWERQLDDLNHGLAWCSEQLAQRDISRYRLNGFVLEPVQ
jgi:hypothetical protein